MKRLLWSIFLSVSCFSATYAQLASWPLTSNINGTGGPGITAHPVAFGSGFSGTLDHDFGSVRASCSCVTGLRVWDWRVTGSPSLNATTAVAQNRYVEFSFTNNTGSSVTVNSFDFTSNAGFSTNCTGIATYSSLRWLIDGVHGSPQWIRNPAVCGAEQSLNINSAGTGNCTNFSRPSSAACAASGWTLSNPAVVADGQRIRFRIYIATSHSESTWRVVFGNVVINGSNPLAVTMDSFSAYCQNNQTSVYWSTASEQNASHFDLEHSRDGETWEYVKTIQASGNSNTMQYYFAQDYNNTSIAYYRLRQVDFDGAEEIHGPISVECNSDENNLVVFPNPSLGEFAVQVNSNKLLENASVVVYDISGKRILSKELNSIVGGSNTIYFNNSELVQGTYFVVVENDEEISFVPVKLLIQD